MSFPAPSIPAPALAPYQLSYGGVIFGGVSRGTPYQLASTGINGSALGLTAIQSGDVQRPLDDGEFAGVDVAEGRDIPIDLVITSDGVSLDHARQELGGAFAVAGATEQPLFLALPSGVFACMARPRKYNPPLDINTLLAGTSTANMMLHSTDSRWYASPSKTQTVGLPGVGGGLAVPAAVPWVLGAGSAGGFIEAWNLGYVPMFATFTLTGPCEQPSITNLSIPGAPQLTFEITLAAGDTLAIDTDWHTVTYTTAGSSVGAPADHLLAAGSTWFPILPANGKNGIGAANQIRFLTLDAAPVTGTLSANWADAYPAI